MTLLVSSHSATVTCFTCGILDTTVQDWLTACHYANDHHEQTGHKALALANSAALYGKDGE